MAGFGATIFYFAIRFFENIFLIHIIGMNIPRPLGEGGSLIYTFHATHFYFIPLIVALGGLISGLIIYTTAPEAEGHGTDAAIRSFHYKQGKIRHRIPFIKTLASAITIGSGGSAGRECEIIEVNTNKYLDLKIITPVKDLTMVSFEVIRSSGAWVAESPILVYSPAILYNLSRSYGNCRCQCFNKWDSMPYFPLLVMK